MSDEENEIPRIQQTGEKLPINKETLDIIVANIIPSSKYFETRFDYLEHRVIRIESEMKDFRSDVDKRFTESRQYMDRRFDEAKRDIDRRFDEAKQDTNNRFEQVDKRFEQMIKSIDNLSANLQDRDKEQRNFTLKMFSIAFVGVLGVALKLFVA